MICNVREVTRGITMAIAISLLSAGCATEPKLVSAIALPKPQTDLKGKTVVVSGFLQSEHAVSVTQSEAIRQTLESAYVHDISGQVASSLRSKGIPAEGRIGATPSSLADNEVLVRGAFIPTGALLNMGAWEIMWGTIGIVGYILPSPLPFRWGSLIIYRVEIIDSDGRILVQTGDKQIEARSTGYYVYGSPSQQVLQDLVYANLMDSLADALK